MKGASPCNTLVSAPCMLMDVAVKGQGAACDGSRMYSPQRRRNRRRRTMEVGKHICWKQTLKTMMTSSAATMPSCDTPLLGSSDTQPRLVESSTAGTPVGRIQHLLCHR